MGVNMKLVTERKDSACNMVGVCRSESDTEEAVEIIRGIVQERMAKEETMLARYFYNHGWYCASRPWEVIIGMITLTVCTMSMSLLASTNRVCGWNTKCNEFIDDTRSSDTIILTLIRCLAVGYLYLQLRNMRKLGSKYLLGMAGVFTMASSIIFSVAVINIVGSDLTGLHEALPFFLLLVDLSKACTLAKVAFSALNEDEVVTHIALGMAKLGPQLTLDAIVETLVIGVGTLSGIRTLETMCCFGCLSVVANYLAFMTFYPACLALILEVTRGQRSALVQLKLLVKLWQDEENNEKPNPVTQRVKMIMSAGLVFVHLHSRLFVVSGDDPSSAVGTSDAESFSSELKVSSASLDLADPIIMPEISLWWFFFSKFATVSIDYILTLILAVLLSIKYVFFDEEAANSVLISLKNECHSASCAQEEQQQQNENVISDVNDKINTLTPDSTDEHHEMNSVDSTDDASNYSTSSSRRPSPCLGAMFQVGDSSDEDESRQRNNNKIGVSVETQTDDLAELTQSAFEGGSDGPRDVQECLHIMKSSIGAGGLTDEELLLLVNSKHIPSYKLESVVGCHERGVGIRRKLVAGSIGAKSVLENLPYNNYNYKYVDGACCENVIGYMPVPVGVAGPLMLDGKQYTIPMATTEGCLVASTNRGCRALSSGSGVTTTVYRDGMTRAPVVRFTSAQRASQVYKWLEDKDNYDLVAEAFDSTSRFARLQKLQIIQVSRCLYIRFLAVTGDAMGMNMLSKGSEKALTMLQEKFFPDMEIMSLSGNVCTDKKPSALNWIEGRGKSVVAEAIVSSDVIKNVLKTSVAALVDLNVNKNLIGSAAAGSIGGFNAQAANIVTAIYIATGQDPAQNVCSSHCITVMEPTGSNNEDLYISCTMPSIEVGTIGGGTVLPPQAACLEMLGLRGSNKERPGTNAADLARVVCAAVMAGELSLMSALAAGHLVKSHLKHNRSVQNMAPGDAMASSASVLPRRGSAAAAIPSSAAVSTDVPSSHSAAAEATRRWSAAAACNSVSDSSCTVNKPSAAMEAATTCSAAEIASTSSHAAAATAATTRAAAAGKACNSVNKPAAVTTASAMVVTSSTVDNATESTVSMQQNLSQPSALEPGTCLKLIS